MATQDRKTTTDFEAQAIALAEQIGRIAGTIEGTAESWVNQRKLADQLTRVRDSAAQMLQGLKKSQKKKAVPARPRRVATADPAHAPGKRRRKPAPSLKGVKKSDERIPKLRTAAAVRQRRKSYA
jgi:hypothetical protein